MMRHLSDMEVQKFLSLEPDEFARDIFLKIKKCDLNVFYEISRFKYPKQQLRDALYKREILFRDIEFSEDNKFFRRIEPKEPKFEDNFDKAIEMARNMYFVHVWSDEMVAIIENDPAIKSAMEKQKQERKDKYFKNRS